ncbi:unnamed protein product [Ceratitis capitata]|uniref:(Mediterranean fruit fly) hypothetical protein n=1 Tax=Ceratitis capitata TaxID=7213 RepID=A0A811UCL3_CERCA|nr:unnamed protein product [Ceratitis capitata]
MSQMKYVRQNLMHFNIYAFQVMQQNVAWKSMKTSVSSTIHIYIRRWMCVQFCARNLPIFCMQININTHTCTYIRTLSHSPRENVISKIAMNYCLQAVYLPHHIKDMPMQMVNKFSFFFLAKN